MSQFTPILSLFLLSILGSSLLVCAEEKPEILLDFPDSLVENSPSNGESLDIVRRLRRTLKFPEGKDTQLEMSSRMAFNLCQKLKESKFQSRHQFLWAKIVAEAPEKVQPVEEKKKETDKSLEEEHQIFADCFTVRHVKCDGAPRFPLPADCGHFSIVPINSAACDLQSKKNSKDSRKRREAQSDAKDKDNYKDLALALSHLEFLRTEQKTPMTLNHATVVDLCMAVSHLPVSSEKPFQVKFTPIRLDLLEPHQDLADKCLKWQWNPVECQASKSSTADTEDCGSWTKIIDSSYSCDIFRSAEKSLSLANITENQLVPFVHADFVQVDQAEESPIDSLLHAKLDMKTTDWSARDMALQMLKGLIECSLFREDKSSRCEVLPQLGSPERQDQGSRRKRDSGSLGSGLPAVARVKRNHHRCLYCECGHYCKTLGFCDMLLDNREHCTDLCGPVCPNRADPPLP